MVNFLIKKGIVGSETGANTTLVVLSLLFIVVAGCIVYFGMYYRPTSPIVPSAQSARSILINQKTQEYIKEGMTPANARLRALAEPLVTATSTTTK